MRIHLLLVPALFYSLAAIGADNEPTDPPQAASERWGDLAPEFGSCDERTRAAGLGAPWISSADSARDGAPRTPTFTSPEPPETAPVERRP